MDLQRDYPKFKLLLQRLCETLDKPCKDELVESWWKSLRHVELVSVERRIDAFLATATADTKFPRPAMMRDADAEPPQPTDVNFQRGYWRSGIVSCLCTHTRLTYRELEQVLIQNRDGLERPLQELLNDYATREPGDEGALATLDRRCVDLVAHAGAFASHRTHLSREQLTASAGALL
ncbi:MAG TPA: hypothetical protein VGG49_13140 [Steroidobacteraceae bacterium]|jgi:hypothetical protein